MKENLMKGQQYVVVLRHSPSAATKSPIAGPSTAQNGQ
eukprot:SAG22_NODE_12056_length_458_cov_0.710306_1_plen_37_part_10